MFTEIDLRLARTEALHAYAAMLDARVSLSETFREELPVGIFAETLRRRAISLVAAASRSGRADRTVVFLNAIRHPT